MTNIKRLYLDTNHVSLFELKVNNPTFVYGDQDEIKYLEKADKYGFYCPSLRHFDSIQALVILKGQEMGTLIDCTRTDEEGNFKAEGYIPFIKEENTTSTTHALKVKAKSSSPNCPAQGFDVQLEVDGKRFNASYLKLEFTAGRKAVEATIIFSPSEIDIDADFNLNSLLETDKTTIGNWTGVAV